jgi:hypothetical protein
MPIRRSRCAVALPNLEREAPPRHQRNTSPRAEPRSSPTPIGSHQDARPAAAAAAEDQSINQSIVRWAVGLFDWAGTATVFAHDFSDARCGSQHTTPSRCFIGSAASASCQREGGSLVRWRRRFVVSEHARLAGWLPGCGGEPSDPASARTRSEGGGTTWSNVGRSKLRCGNFRWSGTIENRKGSLVGAYQGNFENDCDEGLCDFSQGAFFHSRFFLRPDDGLSLREPRGAWGMLSVLYCPLASSPARERTHAKGAAQQKKR